MPHAAAPTDVRRYVERAEREAQPLPDLADERALRARGSREHEAPERVIDAESGMRTSVEARRVARGRGTR